MRYGGALLVSKDAVLTAALPMLTGPSAAECCAPAVGENPALDAERVADVAKALSEPLRVRIIDVLRRSEEPVCQCELIALYGIKQSLLSHHMKKLVDIGLVSVERRHRWAYYSIAPEALKELTAWLS
jgi:ArsR family transcriptional regulator, arsenate/arsenite/antimonite-responsive transcriptional repressor